MVKIVQLLLLLFIVISVYPQENEIISTLEVYNVATDVRTTILKETAHFEAPNWSMDGNYFIINQSGSLYKISMDGKAKKKLPTENLKNCNNDHGISFDGKTLAISNNDTMEGTISGTSRIYTMPMSGGVPKLITPLFPSYWHGWSPDGRNLVYTAKRNDNFDIYSIASNGGEETRLTDSEALDDGPEYSPDGKYIYYNTTHSGSMDIWRMHPDGKNKEQLTDDAYSNWFAHPSPNGEHFVFISYLEDQGDKHPSMKRVALRLYNLQDGNIKTLYEFTGGQGTINVPSWSPDGERFAFVSYEKVNMESNN